MTEKKHTRKPMPPRQMGVITISKGPYLEPISIDYYLPDKFRQRRRRPKRADWDETFDDGTCSTSRHYPEPLSPKLN